MDVADAYRSPPIKPEPRWGREDTVDRNPMNEPYRRRSPGKQRYRGIITFSYPHLTIIIPSFTLSDSKAPNPPKMLVFTASTAL